MKRASSITHKYTFFPTVSLTLIKISIYTTYELGRHLARKKCIGGICPITHTVLYQKWIIQASFDCARWALSFGECFEWITATIGVKNLKKDTLFLLISSTNGFLEALYILLKYYEKPLTPSDAALNKDSNSVLKIHISFRFDWNIPKIM